MNTFSYYLFFVYNIKNSDEIKNLLDTINNFPPLAEESSTFSKITDLKKLSEESEEESKRLKSEYFKLKFLLDQINDKMCKRIV